MSLDLSDNNLKDLLILVENLKSLPKLRTLLLCGNPVSVSLSAFMFLEEHSITRGKLEIVRC